MQTNFMVMHVFIKVAKGKTKKMKASVVEVGGE